MHMRKVIIIEDWNKFNGLGLVRSFGVNGVKPYGIITCDSQKWKEEWLHKSKYWKTCFRAENNADALQILMERFGNEEEKPVVITALDAVMQMIDARYDSLSKHFELQSMNECAGALLALSNKRAQAEFVKSIGFQTLQTQEINLTEWNGRDESEIAYPVLLKPAVSSEGNKEDIVVCRDREGYLSAIRRCKENGYQSILCQTYLEDRTELLSFGAMSKSAQFYSYTVLENIRQYPPVYGVGSYAKLIVDETICGYVDALYSAVMEAGYDGLIDVELFLDNQSGEIYVSEFNWRAGGRNYTSLCTGVHAGVVWYLSKCGQSIASYPLVNHKTGYVISESKDFGNVKTGIISAGQWLKDLWKATGRALWFPKDLKPALCSYWCSVKGLFR